MLPFECVTGGCRACGASFSLRDSSRGMGWHMLLLLLSLRRLEFSLLFSGLIVLSPIHIPRRVSHPCRPASLCRNGLILLLFFSFFFVKGRRVTPHRRGQAQGRRLVQRRNRHQSGACMTQDNTPPLSPGPVFKARLTPKRLCFQTRMNDTFSDSSRIDEIFRTPHISGAVALFVNVEWLGFESGRGDSPFFACVPTRLLLFWSRRCDATALRRPSCDVRCVPMSCILGYTTVVPYLTRSLRVLLWGGRFLLLLLLLRRRSTWARKGS